MMEERECVPGRDAQFSKTIRTSMSQIGLHLDRRQKHTLSGGCNKHLKLCVPRDDDRAVIAPFPRRHLPISSRRRTNSLMLTGSSRSRTCSPMQYCKLCYNLSFCSDFSFWACCRGDSTFKFPLGSIILMCLTRSRILDLQKQGRGHAA